MDQNLPDSLDEVRRALAEATDRLLALAPDDTVARAELRARQAALRARAAELRAAEPEDADQLRVRLAHLERRLEGVRSRRIAPVGGGATGVDDISGAARMQVNRQIDAAGGSAELEREIAEVRRRLDRATGR
jgi:hypothetical protein